MKTDRSATKYLVAVVAMLIVTTVIFALFLYNVAAGAVDTSQSVVTIIAAVITVFGVLATAMLSLVGVLAKNALDRRTEARLEIESKRTAASLADAESRLKLEVAVRAVQLLSTSAGVLSPPVQRSGALFTLSSLGQHGLALALVENLLATREIDSVTAARILNEALTKGDIAVQEQAVSVLVAYPDRMLSKDGFDLPDVILHGSVNASVYVRDWAPIIIAAMLMARPVGEWRKTRAPGALVGALAMAWEHEQEDRIKRDVAVILRTLISIFYPRLLLLQGPRGAINLKTVADGVANTMAHSNTAKELVAQLEEWSRDEGTPR